jgi:hypothetical protein
MTFMWDAGMTVVWDTDMMKIFNYVMWACCYTMMMGRFWTLCSSESHYWSEWPVTVGSSVAFIKIQIMCLCGCRLISLTATCPFLD